MPQRRHDSEIGVRHVGQLRRDQPPERRLGDTFVDHPQDMARCRHAPIGRHRWPGTPRRRRGGQYVPAETVKTALGAFGPHGGMAIDRTGGDQQEQQNRCDPPAPWHRHRATRRPPRLLLDLNSTSAVSPLNADSAGNRRRTRPLQAGLPHLGEHPRERSRVDQLGDDLRITDIDEDRRARERPATYRGPASREHETARPSAPPP